MDILLIGRMVRYARQMVGSVGQDAQFVGQIVYAARHTEPGMRVDLPDATGDSAGACIADSDRARLWLAADVAQ